MIHEPRGLSKAQIRKRLLGLLSERLFAFGRVDFRKTHLDLLSGAKQHSDCVAVGNTDHAALKIGSCKGRDNSKGD